MFEFHDSCISQVQEHEPVQDRAEPCEPVHVREGRTARWQAESGEWVLVIISLYVEYQYIGMVGFIRLGKI